MAKFFGKIGFIRTEISDDIDHPGIGKAIAVERNYYGDVLRNSRRWQDKGINDNLQITNQISILADSFAMENFLFMKYIEYAGFKWKISDVTIDYPRITLNLGGIYNEEES
jgi:hypothetical protein